MTNIKRTGLVAGLALTAAFASAQSIGVEVNGDPVQFNGQKPVYMNGRVLVPLRGVFEKMGAYVTWHPETDTVRAVKGDQDVRVRINSRTAQINGGYRQLDQPPILRNGTTLVPLRFLSESLGANVTWNSGQRMVYVTTDGIASNDNTQRPLPINNSNILTLEQDTVLPVSLNTRLSSNNTRTGDRFSATVQSNDRDRYLGLPEGTRIEGRVVTARAQAGDDPGILELDFDRLRLPDGRAVPIEGSLISLDNKSIERRDDGTIVARSSSKDNRVVYAGYGAGAGLLVGLLTKRPLENAALGGLLGYVLGTLEKPRQRPNNVTLEPGTDFGVRLDREVAINFGR